jgi:hypothetical protein
MSLTTSFACHNGRWPFSICPLWECMPLHLWCYIHANDQHWCCAPLQGHYFSSPLETFYKSSLHILLAYFLFLPGSIDPIDPINKFRKGIKHDSRLFSVFKDDKKQWNWWQSLRTSIAQAHAQDVAEVLSQWGSMWDFPALDVATKGHAMMIDGNHRNL